MSDYISATQRFETIGDLYYRDTGKVRPGKSVPMQCGYDANDDENRERFDQWFATRAFTSAIERAFRLECAVEDAESQRDALAERVEKLHAELRGMVIESAGFDTRTGYDAMMCLCCSCKWWKGDPEEHIDGCLAAPTAPKEAT